MRARGGNCRLRRSLTGREEACRLDLYRRSFSRCQRSSKHCRGIRASENIAVTNKEYRPNAFVRQQTLRFAPPVCMYQSLEHAWMVASFRPPLKPPAVRHSIVLFIHHTSGVKPRQIAIHPLSRQFSKRLSGWRTESYNARAFSGNGMEDARPQVAMKDSRSVQARVSTAVSGTRHPVSRRVGSIDAARGAAMIFVCLAHFTNAYHFTTGGEETGVYLLAIAMLASPTLILVSGSVTGFLSVTRSDYFDYFRRRLLDRGVFLLLVGHPILASSGLFTSEGIVETLKRGYITDVIAVAIIIGPTMVAKLRPRSRLLIAAALFSLDWAAILAWTPHSHAIALFKHYAIGIIDPAALGITSTAFPIVPWCALYLVGTTIGERLASIYLNEGKSSGHLFLLRIGLASAGMGIVAKVILKLLKYSGAAGSMHPNAMRLLSSYQKFPPSPTYVLVYAGIGLIIVTAVFEADRRGHMKFLVGQLRHLGEASLFVYALQFYVYGVILRGLALPYSSLWPIGFLLTIELLALCATAWNSISGNQLLTVGLTAALSRRAARRRMMDARMAAKLPAVPFPTAVLPEVGRHTA